VQYPISASSNQL